MPTNQIKVEIDGKHIPNVLSVNYGLEVQHDTDGRPMDARPRLARIRITRMSDADTLLGDWASHPVRGHFKSGKVSFFVPDEESKVQSTMSWSDGFVALYGEAVPHIHDERHKPMTEYVEISAQKVKINDVEWAGDNWTA